MEEVVIKEATAKLAKVKGFKMYGTNQYVLMTKDEWKYFDEQRFYDLDDAMGIGENIRMAAPTQSLLQKWLRENHGIEIQIFTMGVYMNKSTFPYSEFKGSEGFKKYEYGLNSHKYGTSMGFDTYEEALEEAILEGLKLIKKEKI